MLENGTISELDLELAGAAPSEPMCTNRRKQSERSEEHYDEISGTLFTRGLIRAGRAEDFRCGVHQSNCTTECPDQQQLRPSTVDEPVRRLRISCMSSGCFFFVVFLLVCFILSRALACHILSPIHACQKSNCETNNCALGRCQQRRRKQVQSSMQTCGQGAESQNRGRSTLAQCFCGKRSSHCCHFQ